MAATNKPAFITFTGIDDTALCKGMRELSAHYPIEWGILIDRDRKGVPLFPDARQIDRFRRLGVRLCAHVCGSIAMDIAAGRHVEANLAGFSRVQVNHGRHGASTEIIDAVSRFASRHGVRGVLQCGESSFPVESTQVDWLYDVSFGEGVRPDSFPPIVSDHPFCGISGGIGPDNVLETLDRVLGEGAEHAFWIDMESGVRSGGAFDLDRCRSVCEQVYG